MIWLPTVKCIARVVLWVHHRSQNHLTVSDTNHTGQRAGVFSWAVAPTLPHDPLTPGFTQT